MEPKFWHARWRSGQIGFHRSTVDRHLARHWPDFDLPANARVLVPLCGKSLDLNWLLARGHRVAGVELSGLALESFCMEHGIPARRRTLEHFDVYEAAGLKLFCGDFFELGRDLLGPFDAVYDRAALISWMPDMRVRYAARLSALTVSGTQTLLITMEYPQAQMPGPPFAVGAAEVERLYAPDHAIEAISRENVLADEPRLRGRGVTELHEVCYRLTRL